VCSIAANHIADSQLTDLKSSGDDKRIEKKLNNFAGDSNIAKAGYLDASAHHLQRMPADLRHIRRIRAGRHRVFYSGHHTQCSYLVFFIKEFKKKGVNDEDNYNFQRLLASTLQDTTPHRTIRIPDKTKP
jgi:hypothetical protein